MAHHTGLTIKRVVILGAGYAGFECTRYLVKYFRKNPHIALTLINETPFYTYKSELVHFWSEEESSLPRLTVNLKKLFPQKKAIHLIFDRVKELHIKEKSLLLEKRDEELEYDYLIIATGRNPNLDQIPGACDFGLSPWTLPKRQDFIRHLDKCLLSASQENDPEKRKAYLSFAIVGAGTTGVELLSNLIEYLSVRAKLYGISPQELRYMLIESASEILYNSPEKIRKRALNYFLQRDCHLYLNCRATRVHIDQLILDDNKPLATYTSIFTAQNQSQHHLFLSMPANKFESFDEDPGEQIVFLGDCTQKTSSIPQILSDARYFARYFAKTLKIPSRKELPRLNLYGQITLLGQNRALGFLQFKQGKIWTFEGKWLFLVKKFILWKHRLSVEGLKIWNKS